MPQKMNLQEILNITLKAIWTQSHENQEKKKKSPHNARVWFCLEKL